MPTVRLPAAPLTGGVSTQPPANRFATQTATSDNTLMFINRGMEKRFGGEFVTLLDYDGEMVGPLVHWVRRSEGVVYFIVVDKSQPTGDVVQVFGADGLRKTLFITDPLAEAYITSGAGSSLDVLRMKTYGDTTFILNQEVTTAVTGTAATYANLTGSTSLPVPATGTVGHHVNLTSNQVGYPVGIYSIIQTGTATTGPWYTRQESPFNDSQLDNTTMPVKLIYDPITDSVTLDLITWNVRLSGDELVNPPPSFIGKELTDITLFQDRLWLSASQQVVSSQSGDLFNFWQDDWTTVVESDRIDITLGGRSVSAAEHLIPFNRTLLIIADGSAQWELQSLAAFTPADTNLVETTNYSVSKLAQPQKIANQLYFISDQGRYSYMWEYFPNFDRDANIGNNVTNHAEGYLPENVRRLSTSENNNMVFAWSSDEVNVLYVYFTYWQTTDKQQSSWCRWVFDSSVSIKSHEAIDNSLYVVLKKGTEEWLEIIPITPPDPTTDGTTSPATGIGYHANMDRKVVVNGVFDPITKTTSYTVPFLDDSMNTVILGESWGDRKGQVIASTTTTV